MCNLYGFPGEAYSFVYDFSVLPSFPINVEIYHIEIFY